jgi:hypothetical protein
MVAHGRVLHERYGADALVVFVGPCIAKKQEMREEPVAGAVDAASPSRSWPSGWPRPGYRCPRTNRRRR